MKKTVLLGVFGLFLSGFLIVNNVSAEGEPVVVTGGATNIAQTSVTLAGNVTDRGTVEIMQIGVTWDTQSQGPDYNNYSGVAFNPDPELNSYTVDVPPVLTCGTTYYYRAYVYYDTFYFVVGDEEMFTTAECDRSYDLVSHWTLNEASGNRADSIGDNDLTDSGTTPMVTGQFDGAAEFLSAGSEYLSAPDNDSLSVGPDTSFEIDLWVKLDTETGTQVFASKYSSGNGYALYYYDAVDRFIFETYTGNGRVDADTFGAVEPGVWYHVIGTHNSDTNTNTISVNGVTDSVTGVSDEEDNDAPFIIGAFDTNAQYSADAVIDEVKFYSTGYTGHTDPDPEDVEFAGGAGTIESPYQIVSCLQLQGMNQYLDAYYVLTSNVDCSDTINWNGGKGFNPIGDADNRFTGDLNGDDYIVTGLYINRADDLSGESVDDEYYVGLFGYTDGAEITDISFTDTKVKGYMYVGGVAGYAAGTTFYDIEFNIEEVDGNDCNPGYCVWARYGEYGGGIAGYVDTSTFEDIDVGGSVKGSGTTIGGLVGHMIGDSFIVESTSSAYIDGGYNIGGLVGSMTDYSYIEESYATGNVTAIFDDGVKIGWRAGGLVGYQYGNSSIYDSYSTGNVSGESDIGGFVGMIDDEALIAGSYSTGNVSSTYSGGGFAGEAQEDSIIQRSYSTGDVEVIQTGGGFVGNNNYALIRNSYSTGNVTGNGSIGGFAGVNYGEIRNSYSIGNVHGDDAAGQVIQVGGFAGYNGDDSVYSVFSTGNVTTEGEPEDVGGLIGRNNNERSYENSGWYTGSGPENAIGDGDMNVPVALVAYNVADVDFFKDQYFALYTTAGDTWDAWDFGDVWIIDENQNNGFPILGTGDEIIDPEYVLTEVEQLPEEVTIEDAIYRFEVNEAIDDVINNELGDFQFEQCVVADNEVETILDVNAREVRFVGLEVGNEINCEFNFIDNNDFYSNNLEIGPSIVVAQEETRRRSSGGGKKKIPAALVTNVTTPSTTINPTSTVSNTEVTTGVRDLELSLEGDDVKKLQEILITKNTGPAAQALAAVGVTGYFGSYTQAALAEYQSANGIVPAVGYFGVITRAQMTAAGVEGLWW